MFFFLRFQRHQDFRVLWTLEFYFQSCIIRLFLPSFREQHEGRGWIQAWADHSKGESHGERSEPLDQI